MNRYKVNMFYFFLLAIARFCRMMYTEVDRRIGGWIRLSPPYRPNWQRWYSRWENLTRRPATTGIFVASQFGEDAILKDENVFSSKENTSSSSYSLIFQRSKFSVFFCHINFILRAEKTFLRNITIWYAFYSKFTTFNDFKKFKIFFEKPICCLKKNPKFWTFWEILLIQSHSTANLLNFDEKKLTFIHVNNRCWLVYASSTGQHRVKKRTFLRGRFCFPYFQYGAK